MKKCTLSTKQLICWVIYFKMLIRISTIWKQTGVSRNQFWNRGSLISRVRSPTKKLSAETYIPSSKTDKKPSPMPLTSLTGSQEESKKIRIASYRPLPSVVSRTPTTSMDSRTIRLPSSSSNSSALKSRPPMRSALLSNVHSSDRDSNHSLPYTKMETTPNSSNSKSNTSTPLITMLRPIPALEKEPVQISFENRIFWVNALKNKKAKKSDLDTLITPRVTLLWKASIMVREKDGNKSEPNSCHCSLIWRQPFPRRFQLAKKTRWDQTPLLLISSLDLNMRSRSSREIWKPNTSKSQVSKLTSKMMRLMCTHAKKRIASWMVNSLPLKLTWVIRPTSSTANKPIFLKRSKSSTKSLHSTIPSVPMLKSTRQELRILWTTEASKMLLTTEEKSPKLDSSTDSLTPKWYY